MCTVLARNDFSLGWNASEARALAKEDHEQEAGSSQLPNKDQSISGRGSKGES